MNQNIKSLFGNTKIISAFVIGIVVILSSGFILGFEIGVANQKTTHSGEPFQLNLVETMANHVNGFDDAQASYFQVTDHGLIHPSVVNLPANKWIVLTIQVFDMDNLTVAPQYLKVNGTKDNQMTMINQSMAMMDDYSMPYAANVTSVPASEILHTFTIPQLNINIPVVPGFTEIAYLIIHKTGTFGWICMAPCGNGAMSTAGWMFGQVVVS